MTPRSRLVAVSACAAAALAVFAYIAIGLVSGAGLASWHQNAKASLSFAPAAAMAAGLAAWWVVGWWQGADAARKWTPFGMAWRSVALAFLLFPPLATAWVAAVESIAHVVSGAPGPLAVALAWVPALAVYAALFGVMLGAMPALCISYFLCRWFLQQTRAATGAQHGGAR
ncbi:MAG: hypothetical protein ACOH1R_02235 [Luteimonas sp.]